MERATLAPTVSGYLDRAAVVRVAAEVADRDGWASLTLSQVARELDRHVSSLYAHVNGLDGLRREVALLAMSELAELAGRAAMGRTRRDALAAVAGVYRDYARAHPGRVAGMHAARTADDAELLGAATRLAEPIRATLRSFGLDDQQVADGHRVFSSTVLGLVRNDADDRAFGQAVDLFVVALESGRWPTRA